MDNEASAALKRAIREKDMEYQIAPPHMHQRLAAERAIQTFLRAILWLFSVALTLDSP
jgi:hypothetical protein